MGLMEETNTYNYDFVQSTKLTAQKTNLSNGQTIEIYDGRGQVADDSCHINYKGAGVVSSTIGACCWVSRITTAAIQVQIRNIYKGASLTIDASLAGNPAENQLDSEVTI